MKKKPSQDRITFYNRAFMRSQDPSKADTLISSIMLFGQNRIILLPRKWTKLVSFKKYYDLECYPLATGTGFAVSAYRESSSEPVHIMHPAATEIVTFYKGRIKPRFCYEYDPSINPKDYFDAMHDEFIATFKDSKYIIAWKKALQEICTVQGIEWKNIVSSVRQIPEILQPEPEFNYKQIKQEYGIE